MRQGPWIPGRAARFQMPRKGDPDVERLRDGVQEGAAHLYVLYLPTMAGGSNVKVIAEAYHPDQLQPGTWFMVDPRQRADWQDGKLVVIGTKAVDGTFKVGGKHPGSVHAFFNLTEAMLAELRRNNRNARRDLKRKASAAYLEQEIRNAQEEADHKVAMESDFADAYVDAYKDTREMSKPHVYQS